MLDKEDASDFILTYGWAILIIIVVVGALYVMNVFTVQPYYDYGEGCKTLCKNQNLEYTSWGKVGGCIVCNCNKVIPMSCSDSNNGIKDNSLVISDTEGD